MIGNKLVQLGLVSKAVIQKIANLGLWQKKRRIIFINFELMVDRVKISQCLMKASIIVFFGVALTACSLFESKKAVKEPSPLPKIAKQEVSAKKVWKKHIGGGLADRWLPLTLLVDEDLLYVTHSDGVVMALNRFTGREQWRVELENATISAGLTLFDDVLLLGTLQGEAYALELTDGTVRWKKQLSSEVLSAPAGDGNVVIFQTIDDKLVGLDLTTGHLVWEQSTVQPALTLRGTAAPVAESGLVFAAFSNGEVKAYKVTDGTNLWSSRIAVPKGTSELERMVDIVSNPLLTRDGLFAVSLQGNVAALDPSSGQLIWAKETSSYHGLSQGYGAIYLVDEKDIWYAMDQRTGSTLWRQKSFQRRGLGTPVTWESYVMVGDDDGKMHVASQVDGALVGRFHPLSSATASQPVIEDDMIYLYGVSGQLAAYKLKSILIADKRQSSKQSSGWFGSSDEPSEDGVSIRNAEVADDVAYDALDEADADKSVENAAETDDASTAFDLQKGSKQSQGSSSSSLY